jgi:hypothetical protein
MVSQHEPDFASRIHRKLSHKSSGRLVGLGGPQSFHHLRVRVYPGIFLIRRILYKKAVLSNTTLHDASCRLKRSCYERQL